MTEEIIEKPSQIDLLKLSYSALKKGLAMIDFTNEINPNSYPNRSQIDVIFPEFIIAIRFDKVHCSLGTSSMRVKCLKTKEEITYTPHECVIPKYYSGNTLDKSWGELYSELLRNILQFTKIRDTEKGFAHSFLIKQINDKALRLETGLIS